MASENRASWAYRRCELCFYPLHLLAIGQSNDKRWKSMCKRLYPVRRLAIQIANLTCSAKTLAHTEMLFNGFAQAGVQPVGRFTNSLHNGYTSVAFPSAQHYSCHGCL